MPVIMRETAIAAGGSSPNLLQGSTYEIQTGNVLLTVGVSQSAAGGFVSIFSGRDLVAEEFSPPVLTRYPVVPDEMYFTDVATIADCLSIPARNPSRASITFRSVVQITSLG